MMTAEEAGNYRAEKIEAFAKRAAARINVRELDEQIKYAMDQYFPERFPLFYPIWIDEGSREIKQIRLEYEALLRSRGYKIVGEVDQTQTFDSRRKVRIGYYVDLRDE